MQVRNAQANWNKNLKDGDGTLSFGSFEGSYSFASRLESSEGTNPEELISAAHASYFSMALANELDQAGFSPVAVQTTATVHFDPAQLQISRIELFTEADVPGVDESTFDQIAERARMGCPISKALTGIEIELDASLTTVVST